MGKKLSFLNTVAYYKFDSHFDLLVCAWFCAWENTVDLQKIKEHNDSTWVNIWQLLNCQLGPVHFVFVLYCILDIVSP